MRNSEKKKWIAGQPELPETRYVRDIEDRVFQSIVYHCLSEIEGIELRKNHFFDAIFGRESQEKLKGIQIKQDEKNHCVSVKIEVTVAYGVSIPEKSEEVQKKVTEAITFQTGLHVSCVHVVFRSVSSGQKKTIPQVSSEKIVQVKPLAK